MQFLYKAIYKLICQDRNGACKTNENLIAIINLLYHKNMDWECTESWNAILPEWFRSKFSAEKTEYELKQFIDKWDSYSYDEKFKHLNDEPWTLSNWLYWMNPENRIWEWEGSTINCQDVLVTLGFKDCYVPLESITWTFKACGADEVVEPG